MALVARVIGQRGTASQPFATIWKRLLSDDGLSRLNIYKDAERAPKEMADEEYPTWLWGILEPELTKEELMRQAQKLYDGGGYDNVFERMPERQLIRLFRLSARERVKQDNSRRRGGRIA